MPKGGLDTAALKKELDLWRHRGEQDVPEEMSVVLAMLDLVAELAKETGAPPDEVVDVFDDLRSAIAATLTTRQRLPHLREEMVRFFTPSLIELDPVPKAAVEQAQRLGGLRATLLQEGGLTYKVLSEGRRASMEATRQFVRRARDRHQLFTVTHDNETIVPAFLLDEAMEPIADVAPVIKVLREAGEDGWALWAWFATPSGWLGNRAPLDALVKDPAAVLEAAQRRVSNVA